MWVDLTKTLGYELDEPNNGIKNPPMLGWKCPECGRVYSPSIPMCFYCGGNKSLTATYNGSNTTMTKIDNDYENDVAE